MRRTMIALVTLATLGGVAQAAAVSEGYARSEPVKLDSVPPAVANELRSESGSRQLANVRKLSDRIGASMYEAEIVGGTQTTDVKLMPTGTVIERRIK